MGNCAKGETRPGTDDLAPGKGQAPTIDSRNQSELSVNTVD